MAEQLYKQIPEISPIKHRKDFEDFIDNYEVLHRHMIRAIKLIKEELKRLQNEKQDV